MICLRIQSDYKVYTLRAKIESLNHPGRQLKQSLFARKAARQRSSLSICKLSLPMQQPAQAVCIETKETATEEAIA